MLSRAMHSLPILYALSRATSHLVTVFALQGLNTTTTGTPLFLYLQHFVNMNNMSV